MASNFCGRCGSPLDPATGRCPNCEPPVQYQAQPGQGYARPAQSQYRQPNGQPYYQQPEQPYPGQASGYAAPPKKDNKNVLIAVLTALVAVLIAAGVVTVLGVKGVLNIPFLRPAEDVPAAVVSTEAPTTAAPVTEAPTTAAPVTEVPTTAAPVTAAPATAAGPTGQQYKLENPMRLRAGPGTGYGYSRVIPTGAYVGVVSVQGDWAYVYYNGEYGWVHGPTAFRSWWNGGSGNSAGATTYPYKATLKNAMKLRTGPSTAYGAKTVVPKGAVVTVYEQMLNDAGEAWARISYNGVEGWVRSKEAGL